MPIIYVDGPPGLSQHAKQELAQQVTKAADETYHVPDVRIWLREYPPDSYAQDGVLGAQVRPVVTMEAPELSSIDAKRTMVERINAAMVEAYDGIANTENVMVLINGYPLEQVAGAGRMQSDIPKMVELANQLTS